MTSASSFQMLRGAVIIFTGLFSVAFLDRRLAPSQWLGILITIAGLVVVGLADLLSKHDSQHKLSEVITGEAAAPPIPAPLEAYRKLSHSFTQTLPSMCPGLGHIPAPVGRSVRETRRKWLDQGRETDKQHERLPSPVAHSQTQTAGLEWNRRTNY